MSLDSHSLTALRRLGVYLLQEDVFSLVPPLFNFLWADLSEAPAVPHNDDGVAGIEGNLVEPGLNHS
jgi:hypothetical protein